MLISFGLLASVGCVGTDVGNPPDDDSTVIAATLDFELTAPGANPRGLTKQLDIDAAWLSIANIDVRHGDCANPTISVIEGPFYANLKDREVLPASPVFEGVREICSLKIELSRAADDAPQPIVGRSLFVAGSSDDGRFEVVSTSARSLPYRGTDFRVRDQARYVNAFDPSEWQDALGPHRRIDDRGSSVSAFFNTFRDASRIVLDDDGDGVVGPTELERVVALPDPAVGP